jgi:hypothetical protein
MISVTVSVSQFDDYELEYRQTAQVVTDAGDIELCLFGSLPPPSAVRHRPDRLTLDAARFGEWADNDRQITVVAPVGHPTPVVQVEAEATVTAVVAPVTAVNARTAEYRIVLRTRSGQRYDPATSRRAIRINVAGARLDVPLFIGVVDG